MLESLNDLENQEPLASAKVENLNALMTVEIGHGGEMPNGKVSYMQIIPDARTFMRPVILSKHRQA